MPDSTSRGLTKYISGTLGEVFAGGGVPTADSTDAAIAKVSAEAGSASTVALALGQSPYLKVKALTAAQSLDDLTAPGFYMQASSAGTTLALGYPADGFAGLVEVMTTSDGASMLIQRATYFRTDSPRAGAWWRGKWSGLWTPWLSLSSGGAADPRVTALAGFTNRGNVTGGISVTGRGTVALTLTGDTQVTLTGQDGDTVLLDVALNGYVLTVEGKATGAVSVWARSRGRWITGVAAPAGGGDGGTDPGTGGGGTTPAGTTLVGEITFASVADGTDPATLTLTPSGGAIAKNNTNGVISGGKWSVSSTGAVVGSTLSTAQQLTKMLATATYTMTGTSGNDAASIRIGVHAGMAGTVSLTVRGDGSMSMDGIGLYTWTMPDLSTRVAPKTGTIAISFDATTGGGSAWLNGTKIGDYTSDWASKNPAGKAQGVEVRAFAFNGGKTSFDGYEMSVPA